MAYGIMNGMDVKIDKSGRIVVPKPLRDRLGLKPDMELEVHEHADGMFLRVPAPRPTMVQVEGLWVHQGTASANADWASVLEDVREERLRAMGSG
jgi:AbrB family looped-hinge helix DNA binding protein